MKSDLREKRELLGQLSLGLNEVKSSSDKTKKDLLDKLGKAVRGGDLDAVKDLINKGVDVNASYTIKRITPLHEAAANGHSNIASLLVEYGGNLDAQDTQGFTPIQTARYSGYDETAEELEIFAKNQRSETILQTPSEETDKPFECNKDALETMLNFVSSHHIFKDTLRDFSSAGLSLGLIELAGIISVDPQQWSDDAELTGISAEDNVMAHLSNPDILVETYKDSIFSEIVVKTSAYSPFYIAPALTIELFKIYLLFRSLYIAGEIKLVEALKTETTIEELAKQTDTNPNDLSDLLKILRHYKFVNISDGEVTSTDLIDILGTDHEKLVHKVNQAWWNAANDVRLSIQQEASQSTEVEATSEAPQGKKSAFTKSCP